MRNPNRSIGSSPTKKPASNSKHPIPQFEFYATLGLNKLNGRTEPFGWFFPRWRRERAPHFFRHQEPAGQSSPPAGPCRGRGFQPVVQAFPARAGDNATTPADGGKTISTT